MAQDEKTLRLRQQIECSGNNIRSVLNAFKKYFSTALILPDSGISMPDLCDRLSDFFVSQDKKIIQGFNCHLLQQPAVPTKLASNITTSFAEYNALSVNAVSRLRRLKVSSCVDMLPISIIYCHMLPSLLPAMADIIKESLLSGVFLAI